MIAIRPNTPEWDAWMEYHRGSKKERKQLIALSVGRPFYVHSRFPPAPQADVGKSRSVDEIAERLEKVAARDLAERVALRERRRLLAKREGVELDALAAVASGQEPNVDGHGELGVVHIEDPTEESMVREAGKGAAPLRAKLVALRDDPVGQMHRRGQLNGGEARDGKSDDLADLRLKTARRLQSLYEIVEIGGVKAMDPGKPVIGGGHPYELDIDRRREAVCILLDVENSLGEEGKALIRLILWQKMTLQRIAELQGTVSKLEIKVLGHRFRECLDTAAEELGYQQTGPNRVKRPRDVFDRLAGHADSPELYRAIQRAERSS